MTEEVMTSLSEPRLPFPCEAMTEGETASIRKKIHTALCNFGVTVMEGKSNWAGMHGESFDGGPRSLNRTNGADRLARESRRPGFRACCTRLLAHFKRF